MEKFLYPEHPVRCNITGPSECGKSVFLTSFVSKFFSEYDEKYIYSPSLHHDLYQKIIKCFSNYIPIHILPNISNEEDIDLVLEEIVKTEVFEKSDTEKERYESIEELKIPKEFEDGATIKSDDLYEKTNE